MYTTQPKNRDPFAKVFYITQGSEGTNAYIPKKNLSFFQQNNLLWFLAAVSDTCATVWSLFYRDWMVHYSSAAKYTNHNTCNTLIRSGWVSVNYTCKSFQKVMTRIWKNNEISDTSVINSYFRFPLPPVLYVRINWTLTDFERLGLKNVSIKCLHVLMGAAILKHIPNVQSKSSSD